MKIIPFWTDQFPHPTTLPTVPLPSQVDVAIVGGGYTGLNAARVLAKNGASVAILERNRIGWGASSRNGGMATTGIKQSIQEIFRRYGEELGRQFWQASLDAIDTLGEVVADEEIECHFLRKGHLYLAYKPSHFEAMKQKVTWMKEKLNYPVTLVPRDRLREEIGTDAFYGGLVDEWSAGLHPAKYVFGLAQAAARLGVKLCENTAVSRIEKLSNGFQVHTQQGVINAKELLVATNGYTDLLLPGLKPHVFPVGSYIIVTEPLSPELQKKLSPKGRMFYDSKWFLNYFRLTPDGRMLFGGRNNLSTNLDLTDSAHRLRAQMLHIFPDLRNIPITHSWTGQLGVTFDLMPHVGSLNGVHYAVGYGGHGVSIATYVGSEVGLMLAGKKPATLFHKIPQETHFFYRNTPWFLPFAAWYYRFKDWWG